MPALMAFFVSSASCLRLPHSTHSLGAACTLALLQSQADPNHHLPLDCMPLHHSTPHSDCIHKLRGRNTHSFGFAMLTLAVLCCPCLGHSQSTGCCQDVALGCYLLMCERHGQNPMLCYPVMGSGSMTASAVHIGLDHCLEAEQA